MIYITNGEKLRDALIDFPDRIRNRVLRKSVKAGCDVAGEMLKNKLPQRTGATFQSIASKVKLYRYACWGGVGPESGFIKIYRGEKHQPSKTFHLIERGFTTRNGRYVPGMNVIPQISNSPQIETAVLETMETEVKSIWAKG